MLFNGDSSRGRFLKDWSCVFFRGIYWRWWWSFIILTFTTIDCTVNC
jgi:hypothetical protein